MAKNRYRVRPRKPRKNPQKPRNPGQPIPYPKNPMAPWSQKLLNQEINKRINDVMGPQEAAINADTERQTKGIAGVSAAAQQIFAQMPGRTQAIYKQATDELGGLGAGLAGQLRDERQAEIDQAKQFSDLQGAPQAAPPPDIANTVAYGGSVIPGSSLASQGAAAAAEQVGLQGVEALSARTLIQDALSKGHQAIAELEAKRPDLANQIRDALYKHELDKAQYGIQRDAQDLYSSQFGEKVRHNVVEERLSKRRNDISYQRMLNTHQEAVSKAAAEGRNPDSALSKVYGYVVDPSGTPILDKHGKKIHVAQSGAGGAQTRKPGGKVYGQAVGKADELLRRNAPGALPFPSLPLGPNNQPAKPKNPISRRAAIRYLMSRYGLTRQNAVKAMKAAGWHFPGQAPRGIPGTENRGPGGTGPR